MEQNKNIGNWSAEVDNSGKTPFIMIIGTFPTNGEKPLFHLRKSEPQGINNTELILILVFGNLADPLGKGKATVPYSDFILTDIYKTVLVLDENGRRIANVEVTLNQR